MKMNAKFLTLALFSLACGIATAPALATPNLPGSTLVGNSPGTVAQNNLTQGEHFLQANKKKRGIITLANGLQYKVISSGSGATPTKNDMVTVDYEGKFIDGKVFDSSYRRGQPATFPVTGVIPGWTEILQKMKAGDTWDVYVPATLAYGAKGIGNVIGPNETLIFKIHLIKVTS